MTTTTTIKEKSKNYFKKQKRLLKFVGVSFTGNESIAYKLYSFLIFFSSICSYTILDGYELFKHDFKTSSGIIIYESMMVVTVVKTTIVLINRIKFGKVLAKLEQEPFLPNPSRGGDAELLLIRECNWKIDVQTFAYWIAAIVGLFGAGIYALNTHLRSNNYHDWELSYGPLTVLNMTHSPNYEITWCYQTFSVSMCSIYFTTIDLTIIGVLAHISYQFKILQEFLRGIITRSYEEMLKEQTNSAVEMKPFDHEIDASKIPWKYLQNSIKQAVQYHQAIIDLAKEMEEFFRYFLMQAFLISLICMCFELYQASSLKTAVDVVRHLMEFLVCVFQVATTCYWGEQIIFESHQVSKAAVESNIVGSDVRFQKALVLIIRRSQTPTKLTAGKFADICLTTFTWFMRASYTAFMVLRNTNGK